MESQPQNPEIRYNPENFHPFIKPSPEINYFPVSSNFCHPLIIFANSFDPDQDQQNVSPNLDTNRLAL